MKKNVIKKLKGFTMFEVVTVVAVVSIFMAVAIPAFEGFSEKADESTFRSRCNEIKAAGVVMAQEAYKLRGESDSILSEALSGQFDGYTVKARTERGRLLQMEIIRDSDEKNIYYTDELQFVDYKPEDFYIPDEPEITTVAVNHSSLPSTTTTTSKAATTSTVSSESEAVLNEAEITEDKEAKPVTEPPAVSEEPVSETMTIRENPQYDIQLLSLSDIDDIPFEEEIGQAVKLQDKINGKYLYDQDYSLDNLGVDWRMLCGVKIDFAEQTEIQEWDGKVKPFDGGGSIVFNNTRFDTGNLKTNSCYIAVDQSNFSQAPDKIRFVNYHGLTPITDVTFFFEKRESVNPTGQIIMPQDGKYYFDQNRQIKSVTIVFRDYTYRRNGNICFHSENDSNIDFGFEMKRCDNRMITKDVTQKGQYFVINIYSGDDDNTVEAVYLNY